jgi:hypothetical protein
MQIPASRALLAAMLAQLSHDSAAGHLQRDAADPGRGRGDQEKGGQGDVFRLAQAPKVALMDELTERGLVERRDDPSDRRAYSLQLTTKGRQILDATAKVAREHQDALCASLTTAEREQLAALLRWIAEEQGLTPLVHPGYRRLRRSAPASSRRRRPSR